MIKEKLHALDEFISLPEDFERIVERLRGKRFLVISIDKDATYEQHFFNMRNEEVVFACAWVIKNALGD